MAFKDVLGNERAKKILKIALHRSRIPNSMLFCGPKGIGKKDVAMVVAKAMNCLNENDDACETCMNCRAISGGKFPDVLEMQPEKNVIKIDHMRLLKQTAYLRPMTGKKRVFVVEDAEKMTEEASNSLLKVLEEPPFFSHIILLTSCPHMILSTITSRCQVLTFSPISKEAIQECLIKRGYEREKAQIISLIVRGNYKQALDVDWEDIREKRKNVWQLLLCLLKRENVALYFQSFFASRRQMKEELEQILEILSSFCRDLLVIKEKGDIRYLINMDYLDEFLKIERFITREQALDYNHIIDEALDGLRKNLNPNVLVNALFSNFMEFRNV